MVVPETGIVTGKVESGTEVGVHKRVEVGIGPDKRVEIGIGPDKQVELDIVEVEFDTEVEVVFGTEVEVGSDTEVEVGFDTEVEAGFDTEVALGIEKLQGTVEVDTVRADIETEETVEAEVEQTAGVESDMAEVVAEKALQELEANDLPEPGIRPSLQCTSR